MHFLDPGYWWVEVILEYCLLQDFASESEICSCWTEVVRPGSIWRMTFETWRAVAMDGHIDLERTAEGALEAFAAEGVESSEPCLACKARHRDT